VATQLNVALLGAMVFGFLLIPLAGTFYCQPGWPRLAMAACTIVLAAAGIGAFMTAFTDARGKDGPGAALLGFFLLGAVLSSWLGNALRMVRPRR
jgi:hypothetical protein